MALGSDVPVFFLWDSNAANAELSCRKAGHTPEAAACNDNLSTCQIASHVVFLTIQCFGTHATGKRIVLEADVKICRDATSKLLDLS